MGRQQSIRGTTTAATGARRGLWLGVPLALGLLYPGCVALLYVAGRIERGYGAQRFGAYAMIVAALCGVAATPLLALVASLRSPSKATTRALLHLLFASPALFTLIGVLSYMAGFPYGDYFVWSALWIALMVWAGVRARWVPGAAPVRHQGPPRRLAITHGVVAVMVLGGFIALHLSNHLLGLWSAELHVEAMKYLRRWYRAPLVEPLLVVLMVFMAGSGFVLLCHRLRRSANRFDILQTLSGAYLLFFVLGHMNSVFVFQRWFMGAETDFFFAAGSEEGLLGDAWSVRLLPHYWLGVCSLVVHVSCGLRGVLLAHGAPRAASDAVVYYGSAVGAAAATLMVLALCRIHVG